MNVKYLKTPLTEEDVRKLSAGDIVFLSGRIYTARDKAHKKILDYRRTERKTPFNINGAVIYHCGPLVRKKKDWWEVVSAGPTTSARMNTPTPELIEEFKIKAVVGKGGMSKEVSDSMKENGCVYLAYTGGAGALAAKSIRRILNVHFLDLSPPEAVWVLETKKFGPLVVAMDAHGKSLYNRLRQ